jgi:hypothetical protein
MSITSLDNKMKNTSPNPIIRIEKRNMTLSNVLSISVNITTYIPNM